MSNKNIFRINKMVCLSAMITLSAGCIDNYLPDSKDAFDRDVNFTKTVFDPIMGKTTFYTDIFNSGNSTLPLDFEITDMMHADGTPAPELMEYYPVRVWKKPYLGTETSIEEINAKRGTEYRRLFDVRKHSGEFVMWAEANSSILRCQPDSGYIFNLSISNSGGYKMTKRMRLMPHRERDFEPTVYDENGLAIAEYVNPDDVYMRYESDKSYSSMIMEEDVHIYFRENKDDTDPNTTLTISFYDQNWNVIDPRRFNETNWDNLFQAGFLKDKDNGKYVKYDMAYPLPIFKEQTDYTDVNGEKASVRFKTSYLNRNGYRLYGHIYFDFAIYKESHWEILIHFAGGIPQLGEPKI